MPQNSRVKRSCTIRTLVVYLNTRTIINGREARQVELDSDRADDVRSAFHEYATNPDMTLNRMTAAPSSTEG